MTLYFDTTVQFLDLQAISTIGIWHSKEFVFAVASYSSDQGGSVTIFDDLGEPLRNITYPVHPISQATSLCWHPDRRLLVSGWENGEVHAWLSNNKEFSSINGPHKAPIVCIEFSEQGGRMVTSDAAGVLTGWRCDKQGQFLTMFTHDLKDSILHITFRRTVTSVVSTELSNLAKAAVAGDETALDALTNWRPRTAARNLSHSGVQDNHCFYVGTESGIIYYLNQSGMCVEVLRSSVSTFLQVLWHPKRETIVMLMEDMTVAHYLVESTGALVELDKVKLSGRVPGQNGAISWAGNSLAIITGDFSVRIWDIDTSDNFLLPTTTTPAATKDFQSLSQFSTNRTSSENVITPNSVTLTSPSSTITSTSADDGGNNGRGNKIHHHQKQQTAATPTMEVFTCIAYCTDNQTLCAGTNQGNLYTWKRRNYYNNLMPFVDVPENTWQLNNISVVRGAIKQCTWGICDTFQPCIMVNCIANVYILKEQPLLSAHIRDLWITQKTANKIQIETNSPSIGDSMLYTSIQTDIAITNLCLNERNILITNGRCIVVYKITIDSSSSKNDSNSIADSLKSNPAEFTTSTTTTTTTATAAAMSINSLYMNINIKLMNTFIVNECTQLFIYEETIIVIGQLDIKIYSLGGVMLQELNFNDVEGRPIGGNLTGKYLTIFTINGIIKIFDISQYEPKLISQPKSGYDLFENFGEIIMAKCNINGTFIAITIANKILIPDGKFYVWNIEKDLLMEYDFIQKKSLNNNCIPSLPISFHWDTDDVRLLACDIRCVQQQQPTKSPNTHSSSQTDNQLINNKINNDGGIKTTTATEYAESYAIVMFITIDTNEIKELERFCLVRGEQLINLCIPNIITLNMDNVERITLCNFKGLENCDVTTRQIILNFSIYMAIGNMDQAFMCIRSIQSEAVWNNLARMCVKTGRLDVAKVCLGHMKRVRSVRALRNAMEDDTLEEEACIAVLAIELDMINEAEALYKKCGRYDLLNKMLQACGRFDEALHIAEQLDRIHLKNTYYKYAEWMKEQSNTSKAIQFFEKSNNATYNITQMLIEDRNALRLHMQNTTDLNLLKWWAQYIESTGDMDSAFKIYLKADDWFSQVRILCFLGQLSKADSVARLSGDKSACYHLARHYENIGKIQEAIQFFTRAQTYGNAVRICKENDLRDELWTVANIAQTRDKATAAAFFEDIGDYKRAVELYHRADMLHKAVEMAFISKQPETLQVIASELNSNSDPELITRCAEFFLSVNQYQKAVHLLANAKQFRRALDICAEHGVPITETLAEILTPSLDDINNDTEQRVKILTQLGDILQEQGDYHTATKKFTQAGNKIRAMKSLLKSGDTEKICFFAGMSRHKDVYIMAANYLQSLNWQLDGKIMKNIIQFYTKSQAWDLLANFYATTARVEIDDYHDYEKAMKSLQEASRCLSKLENVQRAIDNLQVTILDVRKVLEIQETLERGENHNVIAMCKLILSSTIERPPIRHSDVRAYMIEALMNIGQYAEALAGLRELTLIANDWSSRGLLERPLIEKLSKECGIDFDTLWNSGRRTLSTKESSDAIDDESTTQSDYEEDIDEE